MAAFPTPDDYDTPDDFDNAESEESPDYSALFSAPDYSSFISHRQSAKAKDNTIKVRSMMKGALKASLKAGNIPDAATILKFGEEFSQAAGDLSDVSPLADKAISIITAPDNPWFNFTLVAITLGAQLMRNHESEVAKAKTTWRERRALKKQQKLEGVYQKPEGRPVTIKLPFGKRIRLNVHVRIPVISAAVTMISSQTQPPRKLVFDVFKDQDLQRTLRKEGFTVKFDDE